MFRSSMWRHLLLPFLIIVSQVKSSRVGILGGGFAGLAAAAELEKNGIDYVLLEASGRLGGRVYPIKDSDGKTIQLGAEYINGVDNHIYQLAKELDVIDHKEPDYGMFQSNISYGVGGIQLSKEDLNTWETFVAPLETEIEKEALIFPEISLGNYFQRRYNNFLEEHPGKREIFDGLAHMYRSYYENEWSAPVEELALSNFQEWDDGTNDTTSWYLKGDGFGAILEQLVKNISNSNVRLNSEVAGLDWSENYVAVTLKETEDVLNFDHVIVTIPLGFLKRHTKLFRPKLPKTKRDVIRDLGFGNLQKVFLVYEKPWWDSDVQTLVALRMTGDGKMSKLLDTMRMFQVLPGKPNTLLLWFAGEGPQLASKMSDRDLATTITSHLQAQFNNTSIPAPKNIYTYNWNADKLIGGAYSYITPESYENLNDSLADMAAPIVKDESPLICFAGEHTHQTMYQTTVGAYESGIREAKRILSYLNTKEI